MRIGLGLRRVNQGADAFSPATLFASGEAGAWYDPSDPSSMWQDSAGTTAAAIDSPVGRINDLSGNGNHATQATAGKRPILRQTAGGLYYLEFDGVDDFLQAAFTIAQPFDRISGIRQITYGVSGAPRIFAGVNPNYAGAMAQLGGSPTLQLFDGAFWGDANGGAAIGADAVTIERHDGANTRLGVNSGAYSTGTVGTSPPNGFTIGAAHDGTESANFRLYGTLMIGRALTDSETSKLRAFMAGKAGA